MTRDLQLSVIVPVWNGEKDIAMLLDALANQTADRGNFEIIVADNGSTDNTAKVVGRYPSVRLISETRPGSYAARNTAVGMANGKFLLFTDADCVPAPNWIESALERSTRHGEDCLIGGRIELFRTDGAGPFSSRYDELVAGFNQEWNLANKLCVTANWLCSKKTLMEIGMFDASLLSGGDGECAGRFADAGKALIYASEMLVRHPTRANIFQLVRKKRRVIGGRWQKARENRSLTAFLRMNTKEYIDQARWMKNSRIPSVYKPGVLLVVGVLWGATMFEIIRLAAGFPPYRA